MSQFCPFHVVTIGNVAGFVECVREDCMAWMGGGCIRLSALTRPPVVLHEQPGGNLTIPPAANPAPAGATCRTTPSAACATNAARPGYPFS